MLTETSEALLPVPVLAPPKAPDETAHLYCGQCDRDTSLCGFDISHLVDLGDEIDEPSECVVCDSIKRCPGCGAVFS